MERLDKLAQEYNVAVTGRAFFLRPDIPEEGRPRDPRPGEEDGQLADPLRTYAQQAGLIMRRPPLTPYTMYSQEATQYAQEHGKFNEFHHAAYKALWTDGKNLADFKVLQEITESCGLDWPELEQHLKSGHYRGVIQAQHQEALDLGVHAIPSFLIGKYVFSGAHPYDFFKRVAEKVLAEQQVSQ